MRATQYLLATQREVPAEAEVISHKLMLRAGMIRRLASGLYTWLPTGLRVLRNVEKVVREEMNKAGALEMLMPVVQPAELWEESERLQQYGLELLRINDRHGRCFVLGPTHEEVITDMVRNNIQSYKQLPCNFYQIQTKFRDEVRPRFGAMRAREFTMKDAYSFHLTEESLKETYQVMHDTYSNIFTRLGLDFRAVQADTGSIGGNASHEFHVLADSGEDDIAFSNTSNYAANIEMAEAFAIDDSRPTPSRDLTEVSTPKQHSIAEVSEFLGVSPEKIVKTLIVHGIKSKTDSKKTNAPTPLVAIAIRGDKSLNEIKAEKHPLIADPLTMASDEEIKATAGCQPGSIGPIGLTLPIIADLSVINMADFVCGANKDDVHYTGANWDKDGAFTEQFDLRDVVEGDPSPCGEGHLEIKRGIEVGHIFQLGTKYSEALKASVCDESGKNKIMTMGCYGIGVSRVVASAIEQNYDDYGIIWPESLAPFQISLVPMNMHKSIRVQEASEKLYQNLTELGFDVLFDDRKERPGVKFSDSELLGIPHRIVISEKGLDANTLEYKHRRNNEKIDVPADNIIDFIKERVGQ